jgi:hypothetical protein
MMRPIGWEDMRTIATVLVGCAVLSGCSSVGGSSAPPELSDSAGVTIVDSREPQWREGDAWRVVSEPQVTIGVLEGRDEYQLFDVSAAARQSDGDIVVVDGGTREVRLYGRDGTFMRTLGGRGSGPGEFQNPAQVLVTTADSVTVWDNANFRITRFDSAGAFVDAQSLNRGTLAKAIGPPNFPAAGALLPNGDVLVRLVEKPLFEKTAVKTIPKLPPGVSRPGSGALRVSADLSRIDTLMFFGGAEQAAVDAPWGQMFLVPPVAKRTLTAVQATQPKVCIGDQEGPEVVCFGPGASRTMVRWTANPAPVTEWEVAAWRDTIMELYTLKMSEDDVRRALHQVPIPTVRPHYSGIVLDRVGHLWVELAPVSGAAPDPVDHLVFDPTGVLLGSVALPPIDVLEIGDDYVMGIYRDELEIEYLQVHEIVKPGTMEP